MHTCPNCDGLLDGACAASLNGPVPLKAKSTRSQQIVRGAMIACTSMTLSACYGTPPGTDTTPIQIDREYVTEDSWPPLPEPQLVDNLCATLTTLELPNEGSGLVVERPFFAPETCESEPAGAISDGFLFEIKEPTVLRFESSTDVPLGVFLYEKTPTACAASGKPLYLPAKEDGASRLSESQRETAHEFSLAAGQYLAIVRASCSTDPEADYGFRVLRQGS
jgi:hypothetical protein